MIINGYSIDPGCLSFEKGEVYYTVLPPYITDQFGNVIWLSSYGCAENPIKVKLSEYLSQLTA